MSTPSISSGSGEILINNGDIRITDATAVFKCSAAGLMFSDSSTLTTAPDLQGVADTGNVCTEVLSLVNNTLSISTGGPVGVGTASPSSVLSVVGTSPYSADPTEAGVHIGQATDGYATVELVGTNNKCLIDFSKPGSSTNEFYRLVSNLGDRNNFEIYGPGGIALTVEKDNSYVGIGTTAPESLLHLVGDSVDADSTAPSGAPYAQLEITSASNNTGNTGKINLQVGADHNDALGYGYLQTIVNGIHAATLRFQPSGGNVGIGNINPSEKLDVDGNIKASGTVTAGGTVLTSDDRLKHNEEDVVNALATINKLKLKKYDKTIELMDADFNGDLSNVYHHKETGFIAQEVDEIDELKYTVYHPSGDSEPYGLNYTDIHNMSVQAIQELSAENTTLKSQVADLLARVQALENA